MNQQLPPQPNLQDLEPPIKLFEAQKKIVPRRIWGLYRRLKYLAMTVTLTVYYLAPLIRWDRGPNAPDQAILIDLPHARAYWFFIEIWPHEVYYLTAILIFAAIALFFVTSLFGRVWCGYLCPQTVWTDLFIAVERRIQGDRTAQQRLNNGPWTFEKIWKKGLTHFIWLLIGLCTGGAFVFYFNDAPTLWANIMDLKVPPTIYGFIGGLTLSTYVMAGYAREQVCTYMCPYARFQSAMFDKDTLIIGYDVARGEPRGKHKKGDDWNGRGHCVDCSACVQVCPMGIDIRNGLQMECIACGLCVDACNSIMDKLELPRGLIRYDTERNIETKTKCSMKNLRLFRPRSIYYAVILTFVSAIVLFGIITRTPYELHVIHSRNPVFVMLSDGSVRNSYEIHILNKTHTQAHFTLSLQGLDDYVIEARGAGDVETNDLSVLPDQIGKFHVFVKTQHTEHARNDIVFNITENQIQKSIKHHSMFISSGEK